jgi:hypothetical protein
MIEEVLVHHSNSRVEKNWETDKSNTQDQYAKPKLTYGLMASEKLHSSISNLVKHCSWETVKDAGRQLHLLAFLYSHPPIAEQML